MLRQRELWGIRGWTAERRGEMLQINRSPHGRAHQPGTANMNLKLLPLLTLAGALLGNVAASATTIDFSNAVFPNGAVLTPGDYVLTDTYEPFQASGFNFWTVSDGYQGAVVSGTMGGLLVVPSGHDLFAAFLHPNGGGHFESLDGGSFSLNSLEMNWWDFVWDSVYHPYSLTGTFADGTTRSLYGTLEPGQFQRLTPNWSNLSSVSFTGNAGPAWDGGGFVGISEVVVNASPVPEPAGSMLWMAGLAVLGTVARRRIRA
jgi:hypothetical protein